MPSRRMRHPQVRDRLRVLLAEVGLVRLIVGFLLVLGIASAVLALGFRLTRQSDEPTSFLTWWRVTFMTVCTFPLDGTLRDSDELGRQAVLLLTGVSGLIFPSLVLGAVVFRLLVSPNVFVFRSEISIIHMTEPRRLQWGLGQHALAMRGYSATRLRLLDLEYTVVLQHHEHDPYAGSILVNSPVRVLNPRWPLAEQHVPFTVLVPLKESDLYERDGRLWLACLQDHEVEPGDRLFVHVAGKVPSLGSEFTERHEFDPFRDVSDRPFGDIDVSYGEDTKTWKGWEGFE